MVRQTLGLEVAKRAVGFSIGLRKVTGHCGGIGPHPNDEKTISALCAGAV
jgi:hypothetical protein